MASIIILGGVALIALAVLQWWRLHQAGMFSTNFVVLFGIVLVVTRGTVLAILPIQDSVQDSARTASFTLFGTVAGYLAGRKATGLARSPGGPKTTKCLRSSCDLVPVLRVGCPGLRACV